MPPAKLSSLRNPVPGALAAATYEDSEVKVANTIAVRAQIPELATLDGAWRDQTAHVKNSRLAIANAKDVLDRLIKASVEENEAKIKLVNDIALEAAEAVNAHTFPASSMTKPKKRKLTKVEALAELRAKVAKLEEDEV
jgi:hypothetical protein